MRGRRKPIDECCHTNDEERQRDPNAQVASHGAASDR
jgi:hypothetical protein